MWRRRDHERFIGGYDPENEMPDPARRPGERWESDAYRHNARDTRFTYRWDPDRIEDRFTAREPRNFDYRDLRAAYDRGYDDYRLERGYRPPSWGWDTADDREERPRRGRDLRFEDDRESRYRY